MTSKELVIRTLEFDNKTHRAPRNLWYLPWAANHYPEEIVQIKADFPDDMTGPPVTYATRPVTKGDACEIGEYVDEWGCVFENIQTGIIGEVKNPIVPAEDADWDDLSRIHIPYELLSFDIDEVNAFCKTTDKFIQCGCTPRPFEQLQFIRGTEQFYVDLMLQPPNMLRFIEKMHAYYCDLLEKWAKTDVDCLNFMDDWGAQQNLLINPAMWREIFKPMYKDYVDIAHRAGKKIFMHSDGDIRSIYGDLVELGVDAVNSQLFAMGVENLAEYKGKITFWGEIDRQHLLPSATTQEIHDAVVLVHDTLWDQGGCIAQCEFGPGAKPDNVYQVFESWNKITGK